MTAVTGNESAAGIKSGKGQKEEKICIFGIVHLLGGRSVWFGVVVGRLVVLLYTHLLNYYFLIVF